MPRPFLLLASLGALLTYARVAKAGGGAATDSYADIKDGVVDLHGLADAYFQGRLDRPAPATNEVRAFDPQNDVPALGMLRLTVAHHPKPFGFRLDVGIGAMPDAYLRSDPAATAHPSLSRALSYVEQAYVTTNVPVGQGLQVDVGKFETPVGFEDNEAVENWNYSRSLLYLLAEPTYHTGLRLTYPLSTTVAVSVFWVNGWNANVLAGNGLRAAAAAVTWHPVPSLEVVGDYMGGLERAPMHLSDRTLTFRNELDAYAKYDLLNHLAVAATTDFGQDAARGGVSWWGIGAYLRGEFLPWLAGSLRGESYDDGSGFTTGVKQRLVGGTATVEFRGQWEATTWVGRLELRRDHSDEAFFRGGSSTHQDTLGASMIAAF